MITAPLPEDVHRAIDKIKSLRDGDLGVLYAIWCGARAIPALRALLFDREPSGIFEVRCRAVEALAELGAYDVLVEFLSSPPKATDPVERVGNDAVINAAALALGQLRDERAFWLLMTLAKRRLMPGVIAALGAFRRLEAIPYLIGALAEDDSRFSAERALRKLGVAARPSLMVAVTGPLSEAVSETEMRALRSALGLLILIGISPGTWPALRHLMHHQDPTISVLACKACLATAPSSEARDAILRLISLLSDAGWLLSDDIERCLVNHFDAARELIAAAMAGHVATPNDGRGIGRRAMEALVRVKTRADSETRLAAARAHHG